MHFDDAYQEKVALRDGSMVTLRLISPSDKALIARGLENLSEQARYLRFFTPKNHLSEDELRYLTEIDQNDHFAIGAVCVDDEGREQGLGVARFVKLQAEPGVAEPAVVVVDAAQHKGLGRILLARLLAAARERGVTTFKSEVLAENSAIRGLLADIGGDSMTEEAAGETVIVRLRLDAHEDGGAIFHLLRLAAQGLVRVARALRALSS